MKLDTELFGPINDEESELFAVEDLIFDVQMTLQKAMRKKKISQKKLAVLLGLSPARISQFFSNDGANLTLSTIARIAFALKVTPSFDCAGDQEPCKSGNISEAIARIAVTTNRNVWQDNSANNNQPPFAMAA